MAEGGDDTRPRAQSEGASWKKVQESTFTNWCNDRLKDTGCKVIDLASQFDDGITLPKLLEVLAYYNKSKLKYKKNPRIQVQKTENLAMAFEFMKKVEKIELVNIGPQDINEHNLKLMLGLVWTLIQRYQLGIGAPEEEPEPVTPTTTTPNTTTTATAKPVEKKKKKKPSQSAKKILLGWIQSTLPDIKVSNFTTDWNDGRKISALVDGMKPGLIPDHATLNPDDRLQNTSRALDLAEENFGVPQIIAAKDLCVDKPDELSVLTYIGYYCNRESVGKNALLDWINEKIPKYKISDFTSNWKDGMALGCLVDVVSGGQFADYEEMTSTTPLENAEKSMDYAESLGVPKVITPEQFVDSTLDPVTMMTYLTYFKNIKPSGDSLANISAAGPGITGGKAGKETNFVIRGRIPEWAPLDVIITAPDGTKLPFNKLDPVATSCAIRYKPLVPGNYTVEVLVNKEHIRGSPFSLHHSEPPDAAGCFATGDGLTKAIVGEKSDFSVDCSRGGAGQLQIEVHGPGGNIGTEVSESNGRVYSVKYTPIEAGPHTIAATWANNHIDKSPFTVRVIDPKKCTVSGPGLTGAVINQPATFYVKTKKAGQSTLSVAVTGPSGMVPVQTHENEPDSYICTYTPTENGNYAIDAKWEGIPITGSPFHVLPTVPANASKCTVRDLPVGYLRAGKEVNFIVDVTDAGDGLIKASGHGPSIPQKCSVRSLDSNSFETSFSPFEVGQLSIDVTFADQPISGSPFVFKVNDPTKCRINSAALQDGSYMVNQPVDFRVSAQFCGEGDVTAKLHGPKGEETVKVTDKGDGTYLIQFTPTEPGSHAFDVFFDGEQIPDAPVNLFVNAGSGSDDVVVTQPAVNRRGVFVVDTPHVFKVNASSANEGQLTANCVGVFTAHKPAVEIKDVGDKEYMVAINTAVPDEYKVNIIWSGDPVPGSPFTLNIVDKARPENVVIRGPSFDLSQPNISLNADVKDAGVGELSSSCRGHRVGSVPVKITEIGPKLYQLTIEPTQPDQFTISVLWDDEHVTGSPFKVDNIPPDASKVIVIKPDNFSTSVPAIFRVDATDAGVGTLKAHCRAENSANLPVQTDKPESDVEKYRCVVTPIREDVYHFSLLWSGKDVPGSPFKIDLIPKIHADRVILEDPIYSDIEHPVVINVDCTNAGPGKLIARCNGESSGSVPVSMIETDTIGKYKLEFEPPREDDYKVSVFFDKQEVARSPVAVSIRPIFEPVDVVLMENEHAGFDIFEDTVPLPDEDSTPLPPEPMHMFLGDPLHIDVESESEVDLTASAQGIVTGAAPIELVKKDNNNYSIDFKPNKPDRYIISLKYGDKEAPNSPIVVCYSVPVDASKCVILGLEKIPSYPMVNDPLTFAVLTENAGKADLRVTADGPSGSEPSRVEVVHDIDQPGTGIYNVTYTPTAPGEHRVHLQWGNDLIPGCPLVFNIVSGSAITGEIVYPYGSPIVLNVAADCKPKDLEAFAERDGERNKMKVAKDGKGQFKLSWQPTSPGFYDIHVLLKGKEVAGSPYHVQYSDPPNSRKVKVDITPEDIAYVHYPITFSIDTREAGKAELLLRANISKKLKEKSPDFVIKKNDDGTFTATYTPSQPVHHSFEVLFAGQPVEGSPFKLSVVEKPLDLTHILASNLNLLEVHKAVDVYFKLPNGDSISTVTASATGKSIDDADFKLQSLEENGFYRAHFVPSFPDDYQLELLHKNVPVSGSPFPVKVVGLGGFEPSSTPDDIDNPPIVEAKRPFSLLLPLDLNILPEELKVDIDGPPESSVTPDIRGTRGCFSVTLTPDIPGDYLIHVTKDDLAVPGSPYRIIVKEFRSDPSKCFVVPEDRPIFEKSQRFGKPCQFRISTIDAGPGTLNITSRGPGKADVKIYDNNDGTYTCEFSPSLPGQYSIDILWDDQHIGNSPYNLNFKQKKKKVITGLNLDSENFRVGVPHRFKLHCDEVGEGSLEVSIKPPTSAQIKVSDLGNESYQVEILPKEQGNHELAVQYGTGHILGSPFNVTFNEKGDASKCHMISNDVLQDDDGQDHVVFIISTKDAGKGKLTAHADNPGSNERLPVVIDEIEDEKFKIHFDIGDGAEYLLTVKYDTIHIEGSPFKLLFADQTDASVCQADGDGLSVSQVDREAKFNVLCEGGGDGQLTVEISSEDGTMVHPHVSNVAEEEFEVSYNPSKPGKHTITVKWGDNHVTGSPFDMKCYVPLHASNLSVIDPPSEAYLQTPIVFKVRAVEEMNEEGDLTVTAKSRSSTIVGSVKQEIDGSYTCSLEPTVSGKYVVKVTLNGDNIKESPFKIKVSDPPQPQNVKASGPGLDDGYVGQEGNFMLETGTAGTGTLSVRVHGPKGAFRINMRRHPEEERNILVRYDPKYSGKYSIDVTWSEVHIPGSPFKVEIFDQKDDKEGLEDGKAGDLSFLNGFEESGMSGDIQLSS